MANQDSINLNGYYRRLLHELGPQGWWPADGRLEVVLGAILVQNTSWTNAARAIARVREAGKLSLGSLSRISESDLQELIRPAGFYRQKARTILGFIDWLNRTHQGSWRRMFAIHGEQLRTALLALRGLGDETVDAILLYAGEKPHFVADAYSRRILSRHGLLAENARYAEAQAFVHRHLAPDTQVYNEFHALLVEVGKRHCRRASPLCIGCPLEEFLPEGTREKALPAEASASA